MIRIELAAIGRIGRDLQGCEGVMVARDGTIWAADGRFVCTRIAADGSREERVGDLGGQPNGICLDAEGRIIRGEHRPPALSARVAASAAHP